MITWIRSLNCVAFTRRDWSSSSPSPPSCPSPGALPPAPAAPPEPRAAGRHPGPRAHRTNGAAILQVSNLRTEFATERGRFAAVDGVSFSVEAGKTLGIVGESGCGKSVTALSIMGLVPQPPGRIAGGEILFQGRNLLELAPAQMR